MNKSVSRKDIEETLAIDPTAARKARQWRWGVGALAVILVSTLAWYIAARGDDNAITYTTETVVRGPLTVTVTATGTLEPTNEVEISSELSGIVREVLVDHNDQVRKGQVLARLDSDVLEAEVARARANLAAARAQLRQSEATVAEAQRDFARYEKLLAQNAASQQTHEKAKAVFERAVATRASAEAAVAVSEADLKLMETNLSKASIYSPIDGIVLTRSVDPGQTVAASFQAPTLFTLAGDFKTMELQVDVDEADVGLVREGQSATFEVDAYPGRTFSAVLTKLRYAPEEIEGVVTYKAHLSVDNPELLLRPGMTATAEISVRQIDDALLVPNAALRFTPPVQQSSAQAPSRNIFSSLFPRRPRNSAARSTTDSSAQQRVWILKDGQPVPIAVVTGLTDGVHTEIKDGALTPGAQVIIGTGTR